MQVRTLSGLAPFSGNVRSAGKMPAALSPAVLTAGVEFQTFAVVVFCSATCEAAPILGRCPLCHQRTITLAM
jgi:hypothetical protein